MNIKSYIIALLGGAAFSLGASAQELQTLPNKITADTTLTANSEWLIDGYTYVMEGATLYIEPGVTIYAENGTGADATALIVTRGAKIMAEGVPTNPIVFTSIRERTETLDWTNTGEWGGVALLGRARLNGNAEGVWGGDFPTQQVEGLVPAAGDEALTVYGGNDDADSSGVLRYVSIRYTGVSLAAGDEVQGLTLGGVGSGTVLENIEIFSSADDGIEIFGGNVNLRNIVLAYATDDALDLDQGYRGKVQNLLVLQSEVPGGEAADKGGEWDGADSPNNGEPFMQLELANATFIGRGANTAINIRANGAAKVYNSVFVDYIKMIDIDNDENNDQQGRFNAGDIAFEGNIFWGGAAADNTPAGLGVTGAGNIDPAQFFQGTNTIADPAFPVSRLPEAVLNPVPQAGSLLLSHQAVDLPEDGFFTQLDYIGAFGPLDNWAAGWTKLAQDGYFADIPTYLYVDGLGWVFSPIGSLEGWLYVDILQTWIYAPDFSSLSGSWIWITR